MSAAAAEHWTRGPRMRFFRLADWVHFLPVTLLPVATGAADPVPIALALVAGAACLAYAFGWNSLHDEGLGAFPGLSPAEARLLLTLSVVAGILPALAVGPVATGAASVSLLGSWAYSGGPRLKRFPFVGTLANGPIFVPVALLACPRWPTGAAAWLLFGAYALLLLQNQVVHEAQHAEEDRRDGLRTTARVLGPRPSALLAGALGLGAAGALGALGLSREPAWAFPVMALPAAALSVRIGLSARLEAPDAAGRLRALQRWIGFGTGAAAWLVLVLA